MACLPSYHRIVYSVACYFAVISLNVYTFLFDVCGDIFKFLFTTVLVEYIFLRQYIFCFLLYPLILAVLVCIVSCPDVLVFVLCPVVTCYNDCVVPYA
jgi:hypothetical protein